jgi:tRNA pseudouridine55 synthase
LANDPVSGPVHGWLILDKPVGLGSTQAVSAVKRALREVGHTKMKVGHGGTLDPLASGVLPIAIGEATKLAGRMLDSDKNYAFTIAFGTETDTLDLEGAVIASSTVRPARAQIDATLPRFIGPIEQAPPAYSAIKIDGKRAYDRARAGEAVDMLKRSVTVHSLVIESSDGPPEQVEAVTLLASVSKGTYIRSLARDIAHALGTVGHITMLRRTKAGPFILDQAISLDKLADAAKARAIGLLLRPLTVGLDDIPALPVTPEQADALRQGRVLPGNPHMVGQMLALEGETPIALVEGSAAGIRVVRGFNLQ